MTEKQAEKTLRPFLSYANFICQCLRYWWPLRAGGPW